MPKYQINATIKKPGGGPVKWTHYSDFPMTAEECRKNFSKEKEAGKCFSVDVHISDFICKEIHPQVMNWERINHD
uniref:DUF1187 family protein n=6 Tax=Enterobacteriaceae TaxID=543 RepID=A0A2R4PIZ8_ECOLX|nr:DUF1187 family protein [Escherichia coli]AVX51922.1 hypothetical protein [Escherichia coli]